jgi:hypothetical protein
MKWLAAGNAVIRRGRVTNRFDYTGEPLWPIDFSNDASRTNLRSRGVLFSFHGSASRIELALFSQNLDSLS